MAVPQLRPAERKYLQIENKLLEYEQLVNSCKCECDPNVVDQTLAFQISVCDSEVSSIRDELKAIFNSFLSSRNENPIILISEMEIEAIRSLRLLEIRLDKAQESAIFVHSEVTKLKIESTSLSDASLSSLPIYIEITLNQDGGRLLSAEPFFHELIQELSCAVSVHPSAFSIVSIAPDARSIDLHLAADVIDARGRSVEAIAADLEAQGNDPSSRLRQGERARTMTRIAVRDEVAALRCRFVDGEGGIPVEMSTSQPISETEFEALLKSMYLGVGPGAPSRVWPPPTSEEIA